MSHVEPPAHTSEPPPPPASEPPPAAPASPPGPPAATDPPAHDRTADDRIGALEGITGNLLEAVKGLTDALTNGVTQEVKPQKLPWTHRGGKHAAPTE